MRSRIEDLLKDIKLINFEYKGKISQPMLDEMTIAIITNTCRELCDEQKIKCSQFINGTLFNPLGSNITEFIVEGIIEVKNVCDE